MIDELIHKTVLGEFQGIFLWKIDSQVITFGAVLLGFLKISIVAACEEVMQSKIPYLSAEGTEKSININEFGIFEQVFTPLKVFIKKWKLSNKFLGKSGQTLGDNSVETQMIGFK